MTHTLSVKLPEELYEYLEQESDKTGLSKGAILKSALAERIEKNKATQRDSLRKVRQSLKNTVKKKSKYDVKFWEKLRRDLNKTAPKNMTPEEEVQYHRNRGWLFETRTR